MRLFLYLLTSTVGLPVLILALTRLSYRVFPWSVSALLSRAFVWTCAHVLLGVERALLWPCAHVRLSGRTSGRLYDLSQRVSPARWCVTATALHRVCDPCAEEAPGWWDFGVDCAGHDCRTCEECRGEWVNHGAMTAPEEPYVGDTYWSGTGELVGDDSYTDYLNRS